MRISNFGMGVLHVLINKLKYMAIIQPRPTHIFYQCAKCGDDRASFNVICEMCDV